MPVGYAQTGPKLKPQRKKLILTTKLALIIRISMVCAKGASICWAAVDSGTQLSVLDSSDLKNQLLIFLKRLTNHSQLGYKKASGIKLSFGGFCF